MPERLSILLLCTFALVAGAAWPAHAQIYSWRDPSGHLVLSDRPKAGAAVTTYGVAKAEAIRTTREAPSARARRFDHLIEEHARLNRVRPELVRAVVQVESAFNPVAVSRKGALGLMQLMPATARMFNVGNPFDPAENVRAGVAYLRQLLDRYANNEALALAAYNAGPGAVDRHKRSVPPYAETRGYVSKVSDIAGEAPRPRAPSIYRVVERIDGREVIRYTDRKPGL
jgi:soluble lytic murein transglycosylase-like protein